VTFLSTNLIGNVLRNWREATGNVKRWNGKEDMIPWWMASTRAGRLAPCAPAKA
jgi:putative transposase